MRSGVLNAQPKNLSLKIPSNSDHKIMKTMDVNEALSNTFEEGYGNQLKDESTHETQKQQQKQIHIHYHYNDHNRTRNKVCFQRMRRFNDLNIFPKNKNKGLNITFLLRYQGIQWKLKQDLDQNFPMEKIEMEPKGKTPCTAVPVPIKKL